ncbi:MAG: phosphonoacetaldehyde hydrolase [Planctomycetia bacterium]|nr:phosphonoacetaldehyde hydrolase [Planctomycetia bacterium]
MTPDTSATAIRLVVFDWAGTTVDHGCFAPVQPFVEALAAFQIPITLDEARAPMGLGKRDHLRTILEMSRVSGLWSAVHGRSWTEKDFDRVYNEQFIPRQLESVRRHSRLVPGLLDCVNWLRGRGIKIGTSTGYFAEAAQLTYREAAAQGYVPDHNVSPGEVPAGRPAPWMIYRNMEALGVYPAAAVLKVGDTVPDIEEGRNACAWSVGVARTGSAVGLSAEDLAALPAAEQHKRVEAARAKLLAAGAHAVIDSVAELPRLVEEIEARLARGERPQEPMMNAE